MKVAIYLRKSRAEELTDTVDETLSRHKDTLLTFAKNNKLDVAGIYEEVLSGESLYARPQMLKLLEDVEQSLYDAVLCMDIDRLGRGAMSDQGVILETFKASDTKIITPRKYYDLNNEIDEEYTEFETFMARREYKIINRRLKQGLKITIKDGGYVANAPYGYEKTVVNKLPTLSIVEEEARFVRMMFDMYVNQNTGCKIIADTINSYGAKPRRGEKFNRSTVMFILKNPVYIGKIVWDKKTQIKKNTKGNDKSIIVYNPKEKWQIYDGLHPAIVDESLFNQAQEIMNGRYHPPSYKGVIENPLAGIVKCEKCGNNMQKRPYYAANNPDSLICTTKGCMKSTRLDLVEEAILEHIENKLNELKVQGRDTTATSKLKELTALCQNINKEIDTVSLQKNRLHDFLERGVYDIDTFINRNKLIDEKLQLLNSSLDEINSKIKSIKSSDPKKAIIKIESVLKAYHSANASEKNILLKSIIENITYYKASTWKKNQFELVVNFRDINV